MADVTSGNTIREASGAVFAAKTIVVETAATADNGDTMTVTLANYGISRVLAVLGFTHSTTDSVVITEAPTTSVTSGVLTITIGGSTADKKRAFLVVGV